MSGVERVDLLLVHEVLQDHQHVEELTMLGNTLDRCQTEVVEGHQRKSIRLCPTKKFLDALVRIQLQPNGNGVEEHAHHGVDSRYLGRPSGNRGAEDDVLSTGGRRQHEGQRCIQYRVERDAGRGSALTQRTRKRFRQNRIAAIRKLNFDAGHRLGNKRRLLESCERSAPPLVGGCTVAIGQPGEVCLERPLGFAECAVVAAGIVQRQKLTDDKAVGPAVPTAGTAC